MCDSIELVPVQQKVAGEWSVICTVGMPCEGKHVHNIELFHTSKYVISDLYCMAVWSMCMTALSVFPPVSFVCVAEASERVISDQCCIL